MNQKPVILYVEDNAMSAKVMSILLKMQMGLEDVTIWPDSEDFQNRVLGLSPRPELIFLDIHLEPIGGFEMLAILRNLEEFKHVPIVALTASVMNEEVQQLRTAGFDGCIAKPVPMETFPELIDRVLKGEQVWTILE
jgi:CheY-like chemotaxis protein